LLELKAKIILARVLVLLFVRMYHILLLKRIKPPEAECWSIPGGAVEFGETIEDAIKREVREELDVEIDIITLLGVTNHILPMENLHWISPNFLVKICTGHPVNAEPHKHSDLEWFAFHDLPQNLTMTTQNALYFLNLLKPIR